MIFSMVFKSGLFAFRERIAPRFGIEPTRVLSGYPISAARLCRYIVNNGHGLLYNHVIALEDEISFVAALVVLILSIPKAVDTFAKQSKIVKSISFISKVLALLIILMIPYLKDFVLLKKLMSVLDTNILLILILFFAYAGQWAAEIKRKDIKNRKENKEKGNSNEELP